MDNPNITQSEVNLANTPDVQTLVPGAEKLEEAVLKPEIPLTDNGYANDENHQELNERGVDHVCPPAGGLPDGFGVMDFTIRKGVEDSRFKRGVAQAERGAQGLSRVLKAWTPWPHQLNSSPRRSISSIWSLSLMLASCAPCRR